MMPPVCPDREVKSKAASTVWVLPSAIPAFGLPTPNRFAAEPSDQVAEAGVFPLQAIGFQDALSSPTT